ncbi:MAG: hypothetical protein IT298_17085 [Chloroflexi bacterium]|nr:hypothetical protein [Chloroflexota bacterium]MDL1917311.1 hypothetical protein [Anaerolineae bacterium CFX4]MCC6567473.1 hypothetical protein [Chloroflexota bacterium]NOG51038.1 hypothetical protein [Chloroflexota bacterium]RIK19804.1 MAG: hypothetical protein DCC53_12440 [Chloroflexota bacterium]
MNPISQVSRYALIAVIWIGVLIFSMGMTAIISVFSDAGIRFQDVFPLMVLSVIGAAISTSIIAATSRDSGAAAQAPSQRVDNRAAPSKSKNDQLSLDPVSLLTEDDLEELRAEVKQHLRSRLLSEEGASVSSFENLLAERSQQRPRK